jgi:uncharacterized protein YkwD
MRRTASITAAALALAIAACGGGDDRAAGLTPERPGPASPPDVVAVTDGRLGPATTAMSGGAATELSPGGRPELRADGAAEPREGVGAAAACPDPELAPAAEALPAVVDATHCLLNAERVGRGLPRLAENRRLAAAARRYAAELVAGQYFSHTGRDGSDVAQRLRRAGYIPANRAWAVGENLAWGTGPLATPAGVVRAWMNSPGHRANILDPRYREVGLGVVVGNPARAAGAGATYASEFGAVGRAATVARKRVARSAGRTVRRGAHRR